jgi:hypothetical protein
MVYLMGYQFLSADLLKIKEEVAYRAVIVLINQGAQESFCIGLDVSGKV